MKRIYYLLLPGFILLLLNSCIKDEPLQREVEIESFVIEGENYISTLSISQNSIIILVKDSTDKTKLTPIVKLPKGATLSPESGVTQDFSKPVTYTVTAENSSYTRTYSVSVISSISRLNFDFEVWEKSASGYHNLMVYSDSTLVKLWDSGNAGVSILSPEIYPTRPAEEPAYNGNYAAKLETRYGGVDFGFLKIPIFSGSLFYGQFSINISDPRKSLKLGQPHLKTSGKPIYFIGYYKYTPGSPFIYLEGEGKDAVEVQTDDITDEFAIYSLLYRVKKGDSDSEFLDGTMITDDERIIARAEWKKENIQDIEKEAEKDYTQFVIPFEYKEEINYEMYDYKLVIMFASSKDGDLYKGAIGSTLLIDDVEIICESILK